jgi:hypothetical protein
MSFLVVRLSLIKLVEYVYDTVDTHQTIPTSDIPTTGTLCIYSLFLVTEAILSKTIC